MQGGATEAVAVTIGLSAVGSDAEGAALDPTVASIRFSPTPTSFEAHVVSASDDDAVTVEATSAASSKLDALVVTEHDDGYGRFTQLVVDELPTTLSAEVARAPGEGMTDLYYSASAPVASTELTDVELSGASFERILTTEIADLPTSVGVSLVSVGEPGLSGVVLDYDAASPMTSMGLGLYDRGADNLAITGTMTAIPASWDLSVDLLASHLSFGGETALGSADVQLSRGMGSLAPFEGDHASLVVDGSALGLSSRISGLRSLGVFFGDHPRGSIELEPGGQAFVAAGQSGADTARLEVSNLPASLSFDLDPAVQTLAYDASSGVSEVVAGYRNDVSGPTVAATISGLPSSLDAAWTLGDQSSVSYLASAPIAEVGLFAAAAPMQDLDPSTDHYLSVALTDVPADADVAVDLSARHLQGNFSAPLGEAQAVARFAVGGRALLAAAELSGVPAAFDADFGDPTYRFRGLAGPLASASLAVTNHSGTTRPMGQHLAVGYRESTGDFDASMSLRNVSHVEYSRGTESQTVRLDADGGGMPVLLDVDVVVSMGGVDDTVLAAVASVEGLPATMTVELADGALTNGADRAVDLTAEFRIGKAAALAGLGAPLLAHGVAARARACDPSDACGGGTACEPFWRCFGVVVTVNLRGLPTTLVVDLEARTVALDGYQPPQDDLQLYVQLLGLIDGAEDLEGLFTIEGLPSPLTLTAGPFGFDADDPSVFVAQYEASAPLGG